jgi:hypothetical protein
MISYKEFEIEVINVPDYEPESVEDGNRYAAVYSDPEDTYRPNSKHGIRVSHDSAEIASAIVLGYAGATGMGENSYVVTDDVILVCCSNQVYALTLPHLSLKWRKALDFATCFAIYQYEENFIVHGEVDITRITADGEVKWTFSGADIFVNLNGELSFDIVDKEIRLVDFEGNRYSINGDGETVDYIGGS